MPVADNVFELDMNDIRWRADRARRVLRETIEAVPADAFARDPDDGWSAGAALRHVVWVEHLWTLALRELALAPPGEIVDFGRGAGSRFDGFAQHAAELTGVASGRRPLPAYDAPALAREGLASSRNAFEAALDVLRPESFEVRMWQPAPSPGASLRWAIEHVIEHDWDHAVQLTRLAAR